MMQKVLVITGPTGSGKTNLSIKLAQKYNGEIISGDSIQVYRFLDIGSAKIKEEEKEGIKHHLIDILDPDQNYSVADFQKMSRELIADISSRNKLPMIVGGTGLYIRACLYDYNFTSENQKDDEYPELSNEELYARLQELDPEALKKIHVNNRRRLLRAYNYCLKNENTFSENINSQKHEMLYDAKIITLTMERETLYKRINERVDLMVKEGLKKEIEGLLEKGVDFSMQSMQGIGYKEYKDYFLNKKSEEECIEEIKKHSRQFAKRQYTFFNNQLPVTYFKPEERDNIFMEVEKWLNT